MMIVLSFKDTSLINVNVSFEGFGQYFSVLVSKNKIDPSGTALTMKTFTKSEAVP